MSIAAHYGYMHHFERSILWKLACGEKLRWRDLRPEGTESNLFIYHLNKLIVEGLIRKTERGYALTAAGSRYVDKVSFANFKPRFQPKIVTVIILKNKKGERLLFTRKRQPFYGLTGFPYGKIHFGEKIKDAASRELKEKTGLSARLIHRGDMYLIVMKNGELITHMLAHVFVGTSFTGTFIAETEYGVCFWKKMKDVDQARFIPGFLDMFSLSEKSGLPAAVGLSAKSLARSGVLVRQAERFFAERVVEG